MGIGALLVTLDVDGILGIVDVDCVCNGRTVIDWGLYVNKNRLALKRDVDLLIVFTNCFDIGIIISSSLSVEQKRKSIQEV